MEKKVTPENLYVQEKRWLRAVMGGIFVAIGSGLIAACVCILLFLPDEELAAFPDNADTARIALIAEFVLISLTMFIIGALNLRKLIYPCTFWADKDGIHNHYTILCTGTIGWDEVKEITLHRLSFDEVIEKSVLIYFKDAKAFKAKRNFIWRMQKRGYFSLAFRMTYASREEICARLCKMFDYYGKTGDEDGKA